jgi:TolA-binding protein
VHILTKVFVVLAAVLSLLLSALTVTYSVNAEQVRRSYVDADRAREAAEVALVAQTEMHGREAEALRRGVETSEQQVAELRADLGTLQLANDRLLKELNDARLEADQVRAQITQFGVANETQTTLIGKYRDEVTRLRENELRFRDQRLSLEDTIADQSSQILVLEQQRRALEEQIAELRDAAQGGSLASAGEGDAPVLTLDRYVQGRVSQIRTEAGTGEPLVQLNVGSSDGLRENVEMYVVRDGTTFIANVVVESVDLQNATARVTLTAQGASVREGDEVRSRLLP